MGEMDSKVSTFIQGLVLSIRGSRRVTATFSFPLSGVYRKRGQWHKSTSHHTRSMSFILGIVFGGVCILGGGVYVSHATKHHRFNWKETSTVQSGFARSAVEWTLRTSHTAQHALHHMQKTTNLAIHAGSAWLRNYVGVKHHRRHDDTRSRAHPKEGSEGEEVSAAPSAPVVNHTKETHASLLDP